MSGGTTCDCKRPIRERGFVIDRNCNYSKFNGSRYQWSAYSSVVCGDCKRVWRTKAAYVDDLPDVDYDQWIKTGKIGAKSC